ncbi:DUF4097 domain-containing protein [Alteribacillus sp. HJP-4]|uniref:DUF4097 family beta strand repeat-containing protein n=1 Tax=Alteribacillus sp. HJP-4 TaxID=2775394 RepID=UPI0035CD3421
MEEERKLILKMIDEGKISPEDGTKLLKALKSDDTASQQEQTKTESHQKDNEPSVSGPDKGRSLSTNVNWEEGNRRQKEWNREKQRKADSASTFTSFIDNAITKIKELDLDFNFGTYHEVHHIFQHKYAEQTVLDVSLENGSLDVKPWDENDIKIECKVKVYKGNSEEEAREEFLKETVFEVEGNQLDFYTKTKSIKVQAVMYIPRRTYERIQLYTFNGYLTGESIKADSFSAKTVNGAITLDNLNIMRCHAETLNGPLKINGGVFDIADMNTMNGSIEIEAEIRDLEAESVNGTINGRLSLQQDARAALAATTGSIFVTLPDHIRTEGLLKTNVGNYNYALSDLSIIEEKKDFMQKSLRFVSNEKASPRLRLDAETKTGSISLKPGQL